MEDFVKVFFSFIGGIFFLGVVVGVLFLAALSHMFH